MVSSDLKWSKYANRCFLKASKFLLLVGWGGGFRCLHWGCIHSKSWGSWGLNPADDLEFSAEKLSENATSIKITLFAELLTVISPIFAQ